MEAKQNLAVGKLGLRPLTESVALQEEVLAVRARTFPPDDGVLLGTRFNLMSNLLLLMERERILELLPDQIEGVREAALRSQGLAPRQARAVGRTNASFVRDLVTTSAMLGDELLPDVVAAVETTRHSITVGWAGADPDDAELARLRADAGEARRRLAELGQAAPSTGDVRDWREGLQEASRERDRLLRAVRERLARSGALAEGIDVGRLAATLEEGDVAVGFLRLARPESGGYISELLDAVVALAVTADGKVRRVPLGQTKRMKGAVSAWRASLGVGGDPARGIQVRPAPEDAPERRAGEALRALVLDPIVEAVGLEPGATLHVCVDDFLHLVPIDALPLADDGRVGDRYRLLHELSFGRPIAPPPDADGTGLLAVGARSPARRRRSRASPGCSGSAAASPSSCAARVRRRTGWPLGSSESGSCTSRRTAGSRRGASGSRASPRCSSAASRSAARTSAATRGDACPAS
jgi:hypothetical protein